MSLTFRVRPKAETELAEAFRWYEDRRRGLGEAFLEHVEEAFRRIQNRPLECPNVYREARKCLVARFPYAVFFVVTQTQIDVVAVIHTARDTAAWKKRVD